MTIPRNEKVGSFLCKTTWVLVFLGAGCAQKSFEPPQDYPIASVSVKNVRITDSFWAPRQETLRKATLPHIYERLVETGRIGLFERAAAVLRGERVEDRDPPQFPFDDTDVYKWLEAASFWLAAHPDDVELDRLVDEVIAKVAAAQEPDGYLYTTRTINPENPHKWAGKGRWELVREGSHELYNLGHLFEAAAAHYQATGKRNLLDVALKAAELLDRTFGPGKESVWPGHPVVEMGLARLYRVTGDERWVSLARFMIEERGPDGKPGSGKEYNQSHRPVLEQDEAVGHAVRAVYLYSGMADVGALAGVEAYWPVLEKLWMSVVARKMYVTGGIGATSDGEAFAEDYVLPNLTAYSETCAAIGGIFWNQRMFRRYGDGRYVDVLERALYNGALSGISLDGKAFFYTNPLESDGKHRRTPWFLCACCPPNIARLLGSVGEYVYAAGPDSVYVNLFIGSTAEIEVPGRSVVRVRQETEYPWAGNVKVTVEPSSPARFSLRLRVPGWTRDNPVPSDLYRFAEGEAPDVKLSVNGGSEDFTVEKGYVVLDREWVPGDVVEMELPMPVRRVLAHEAVEADRGRVALQRGPLVYALEGADHPDGRVRNLVLADESALQTEHREHLLGGVVVITGPGRALAYDSRDRVTRKEVTLTAIPYYAWANREPGEMAVWIPRTETLMEPAR